MRQDMVKSTWTIPGEQMKNNQSLTLALSEEELDLLKARRKKPPGEWVFPGDWRTGHYVEPKRAWARLLRRAKIEDLHIHDLRRSLASFVLINLEGLGAVRLTATLYGGEKFEQFARWLLASRAQEVRHAEEDGVKQKIVGFHQDEHGDWVADLACGHGQHVRHQPPLSVRVWATTEEGRRGRFGSALNCLRCDEGG